jgi:hypothetical protein
MRLLLLLTIFLLLLLLLLWLLRCHIASKLLARICIPEPHCAITATCY